MRGNKQVCFNANDTYMTYLAGRGGMFYSINGIASCDRFEKEIIICVKDEVTGQLYDLWTKTSEHEIDGALVELYDLMLEYVFGDIESYYRIDHFLPSLTKLAGFDAESAMSSDSYNAMLQRINDNSLIKRDMLLVDLQFLIGSIQNLILSICKDFLNIYTCLSGITGNIQYFGNKAIFASGGNCEGVFSFLTSYFTKASSSYSNIHSKARNEKQCIVSVSKNYCIQYLDSYFIIRSFDCS